MKKEEYKTNLREEISRLSKSLFTQIDEEKEGYVANLEGLDCCKAPLIIYFTKFNLRLDEGIIQLLKHARQIKEMGIENDLLVQQAAKFEYSPEEVEAFQKWKETVRLLRDKVFEYESLPI